jgi:hypothetical protein
MSTWKIRAAEMDYGPEESQALRERLIEIRDKELNSNHHGVPDFGNVVALSHVIAWMAVTMVALDTTWKETYPNV